MIAKRRNRAPVAAENSCLQCTNYMESKQLKMFCGHSVLNVRGGDIVVESTILETRVVTPYNISLNGWKIIFQIIFDFD